MWKWWEKQFLRCYSLALRHIPCVHLQVVLHWHRHFYLFYIGEIKNCIKYMSTAERAIGPLKLEMLCEPAPLCVRCGLPLTILHKFIKFTDNEKISSYISFLRFVVQHSSDMVVRYRGIPSMVQWSPFTSELILKFLFYNFYWPIHSLFYWDLLTSIYRWFYWTFTKC